MKNTHNRRRKLYVHYGHRRVLLATYCGKFVDYDRRRVGHRTMPMDWYRPLGRALLRKLNVNLRELTHGGEPMALVMGPFRYDVVMHDPAPEEFTSITCDCDPGEFGFAPEFQGMKQFNRNILFASDSMLKESWRREHRIKPHPHKNCWAA